MLSSIDSAIINAGAAFQFTSRLATYLGYQGELGRDHYNANAVTGGFSFSFLLIEADDLQKAKEFAGSVDLREKMQEAGVVDKPDIYFLS